MFVATVSEGLLTNTAIATEVELEDMHGVRGNGVARVAGSEEVGIEPAPASTSAVLGFRCFDGVLLKVVCSTW